MHAICALILVTYEEHLIMDLKPKQPLSKFETIGLTIAVTVPFTLLFIAVLRRLLEVG